MAMALSDRLRNGNSGHLASHVRHRSSLSSVGGSRHLLGGVGNSLPMARWAEARRSEGNDPLEDAPAVLLPVAPLFGRQHR